MESYKAQKLQSTLALQNKLMADTSIIDEIKEAIDNIDYGSVEVIVQNGEVTQISTRIIKKTNLKNNSKITGVVRKESNTKLNVNFKYWQALFSVILLY